jgi:hypothetical protein
MREVIVVVIASVKVFLVLGINLRLFVSIS